MTTVVISQPMYFPWVGLLEQFKAADVFVFYDDVQFVKGSLFNRVQIKTEGGIRWLTIPLAGRQLEQSICNQQLDDKQDWRQSQLSLLKQAYANAPFRKDMLSLVAQVFATPANTLSDFACGSILALGEYFGLNTGKTIVKSSAMGINGASSQRVFDICQKLGATRYLTGHGASRYLDHELFERDQIEVGYMDYQKLPYPQQHGDFTPFVSALDLVANCGREGAQMIAPRFVPWREFLKSRSQRVDT